MPLFASRRLASTSCVLLPIEETIPMPVTTTRRIFCLVNSVSVWKARAAAPPSGSGACRRRRFVAEQAHFQVGRPIDHLAVGRQPAIGDAEHEFRAHDALDLDAVNDAPDRRQDLT